MELNKYFFEALRLRLENILRALSNNRKAHIVYSDSIATDVKNTVYLQPRDSIESGVKADLAELLIFYKACVSHEGAHIRFTSLKDWKDACGRGSVFQHLVNIIEDGRIEAAIAGVLPGAGRWIRFTNQYMYNHRKPEAYGNGLQAFLMGLNVYSILQTVPPFLSPEIQRLIKLAAPYVDIGRAASTTRETLECTKQILLIPEIKTLVDACAPPPMIEGDKGTKNPEQTNPSEETSERAEKAIKIIQRRKSHEHEENDRNHKESKRTAAVKKEEDTSNDNNEVNSEFGDNNKDAAENNNSDNESTDDSVESENPEQSADKDQPAEDTEQNSENNPEHNSLSDDNNEDNEQDSFSGHEETQNNLSDDEAEDIHQDNLSGDEEGTGEDIPDNTSDKDPAKKIADDTSDKDSDDSLKDDSSDSNTKGFEDGLDSSDTSDNLEDASDSSAGGADSAGGEPGNPGDPGDEEDFFSNPPEENFEELLEDTSEEVLSLTKDAESFEEEEKPLDILEGIPMNIHGGVKLNQIIPRPRPTEYQVLKKRNSALTKKLVNEIQVALETRKAYDLRSLNRGKLHSGSLWKLAVPDPSVFSRRVIPGDIPELAVYILVDLSGSMRNSNSRGGPTRIDSVKNAACVISEACRELRIIHKVTGFRDDGRATKHYEAVSFEDVESTKIASFQSDNANRDGFSIRIAANELSFRPEPKKVLFVLSDGQPATSHYHGSVANQDVKQAVFEAKKKGLKVISLFFGEEYDISTFKFMYDTPVFVPDLTILPRSLGEVFKRVLLDY